jgi:acyl-CoA synthetase (AMP-forming)/AMP-acid ligase II
LNRPAEGEAQLAAIDGASTAAIGYTSGTTGRPKGALLSHSTIVLHTLMTALMHGRSSTDTVVSALPCTHVYGNIVMNTAVLCGMTLVLLPRFDEMDILRAIETHRATLFEGVPTMFLRLLNCAEFPNARRPQSICDAFRVPEPYMFIEKQRAHFLSVPRRAARFFRRDCK